MKYLKMVAAVIIIGLVSYIYLYIPTTLKISTFKVVNAFEMTVTRIINDSSLLQKSMSRSYDANQHKIIVNGITFNIKPALSNIVEIEIDSKNIKTKSFLTANDVTKETTALNWFLEFKTNWNPIQRIKDYQQALEIKKATSILLNSISDFVVQPKNIYGLDIKEVTLQDTVLITSKFISKTHPTNDQIYKEADALNSYLSNFQKKPQNNPMVTILENPTNDFTVMVGISINGEIPETANFRIKKMPVNGKMFVGEITGGTSKIVASYHALKTFLLDSKRPSPAVPFELLLNDRRQVLDSTQWKTRIYYPVM
jgi:hypothetical protein